MHLDIWRRTPSGLIFLYEATATANSFAGLSALVELHTKQEVIRLLGEYFPPADLRDK